jgi:hypothetical protein
MGKNTKTAKQFIESIPDSKFSGFPGSGGTIYTDRDYRLDMQGVRVFVATLCPWPHLYPFSHRILSIKTFVLTHMSADQRQA